MFYWLCDSSVSFLFMVLHTGCSKIPVPPGWSPSSGPEGAHTKKSCVSSHCVCFISSQSYISLFVPPLLFAKYNEEWLEFFRRSKICSYQGKLRNEQLCKPLSKHIFMLCCSLNLQWGPSNLNLKVTTSASGRYSSVLNNVDTNILIIPLFCFVC